MNQTFGVLCAGSIVFDILVRPVDDLCFGTTRFVDSIEYRVGGNAANTSRALATLGVPVRILGAVGNDSPSQMVIGKLVDAGVDTHRISQLDLPTATSVALVDTRGDRQFLHRLGASACAFAELTPFDEELCRGCVHFHLASFFVVPHLRRNAADMLAAARRSGLTTSFDTNWDPEGEWLNAIMPCLTHIDTFFMNEDESLRITGSSDPAFAAKVLMSHGVGQVVIKLGSHGCAIFDAAGQVYCPPYLVEAVDTTGAGDCFVAGFLAARLDGASCRDAGQFANAVGALTVQKIGAVEGVVPRTLVREWMNERAVASHQFEYGAVKVERKHCESEKSA